jgi:aryl-alcohol dehydrogenase-like predicted oxidoreductase
MSYQSIVLTITILTSNVATGFQPINVFRLNPIIKRKCERINTGSIDSKCDLWTGLISGKVDFTLLSTNYDNNDNPIDDELSKLIGKREQIKRGVKKRTDAIEEILNTPSEPVVDLDLEKLPSFKTERPVRSNTSGRNNNDEQDDDDKKNDKDKSSAPIIDYMVDYDDENDFHIPNRLGISTICWGDPARDFIVGKNVKLSKRQIKAGKFVAGDVQLAYQSILAAGITLIETSPAYGSVSGKMSSEHLLGRCIQQHPSDLPEAMIITSTGTSGWKSLLKGSLSKAYISSLEQSLQRLSTGSGSKETMSAIDIFTAPKSRFLPTSLIASGLASQIESGQANFIGVQGITNPGKLRKLCTIMKDKYDTTITTNTFDFSLTNNKNEDMIQACKDNNVIPLISNPFDYGLASGIFTATNPSGGGNSANTKFTFTQLEKLQPLHSVQETIAERVRVRVSRSMGKTQERFKSKYGPPPKINTDITTTQIALQYIIAKGGVPLPECNSPRQATDIIGCLGWTLTDDEIEMLDSAIALCKL